MELTNGQAPKVDGFIAQLANLGQHTVYWEGNILKYYTSQWYAAILGTLSKDHGNGNQNATKQSV